MRTAQPQSLSWRKSSWSNPNDCVELAWPSEAGAVRDSKNADGPMLLVDRAGLTGLVAWVSSRAPA
ncbi:DUF397 domain-containing protein [Actinophytocola sp.]|uniref:DUF397 domain-containing protein n=1 Tax=Actinophytocola sp. TaxID=1872138 RepID=UPI003D6C5FD5